MINIYSKSKKRKPEVLRTRPLKTSRKTDMKNITLITEGFGHGFAALMIAQAYNMAPVAFSTKDNKDEFDREVELIYRNLSFFAPLDKATWEEREALIAEGWDIRQELLDGKISAEMWSFVASGNTLLTGSVKELPAFAGMPTNPILWVPQKLQSDGRCGVTAAQQSLSPELFVWLKDCGYNLVLGQHFHKVNDLEKVEALAEKFSLYVPGMTEDTAVFGIRGVPHKMYWNLYRRLKGSIGIAGTHTWYLLANFPEKPQIILYNKGGVENWDKIAKAYQSAGYLICAIGFDEETDMAELMGEVEESMELFF